MCVICENPVRCAWSEPRKGSSRLRTMTIATALATAVLLLLPVGRADGQSTSAPASAHSDPTCESQSRSTYLIGPDDELQISDSELTDSANKSSRIDGEG